MQEKLSLGFLTEKPPIGTSGSAPVGGLQITDGQALDQGAGISERPRHLALGDRTGSTGPKHALRGEGLSANPEGR